MAQEHMKISEESKKYWEGFKDYPEEPMDVFMDRILNLSGRENETGDESLKRMKYFMEYPREYLKHWEKCRVS